MVGLEQMAGEYDLNVISFLFVFFLYRAKQFLIRATICDSVMWPCVIFKHNSVFLIEFCVHCAHVLHFLGQNSRV